MELVFRRIGNSLGLIFPAPMLKGVGVKEGTTVQIEQGPHNELIIKQLKQEYTLADLVAQCDPNAPEPDDLADWNNMPLVGQERF